MKDKQKQLVVLVILVILAIPQIKPPTARAGTIYSIIVGLAQQITQFGQLAEEIGINVSDYTEVVQQVEQLAHEAQMINNQVQNLLKLGSSPLAIVNTIEQLANVVKQGQVLSFATANIDNEYAKLYPGYNSYRTQNINSTMLHNKLKTWSRHNMDNVKAALKAANIQQSTITNERDFTRELQKQSENSEGRMQVLMAANRLSAQEGESLLSLRELVATSIQIQGNWMAKQQDKDDITHSKWDQDIGNEGEVNIHGGIDVLKIPL